MTYEETLINIIDVNNNLLKLKCSEERKNNLNEIKLARKILKEQVESALSCKLSNNQQSQK